MRTATTPLLICLLALAALAPAGSAHAQQQPVATDSIYGAGVQEGITAAQSVGTGLWTLTGFASGALLGPIGTGLAYALAAGSASELPTPITGRIGKKETGFKLGFQQAYTDHLTSKRRGSALVGGLAGTALLATAGTVVLMLQ
jgi:hypothetical protein